MYIYFVEFLLWKKIFLIFLYVFFFLLKVKSIVIVYSLFDIVFMFDFLFIKFISFWNFLLVFVFFDFSIRIVWIIVECRSINILIDCLKFLLKFEVIFLFLSVMWYLVRVLKLDSVVLMLIFYVICLLWYNFSECLDVLKLEVMLLGWFIV